ncbi:MAG: hypothetical protein LUQ54_05815 [Methanoregula sp.]|nr:hypothetical protein [Methanoregula sp.]
MTETIAARLKKFEQEHEVYVSAQDAQTFWVLDARIPKKEGSHHFSRKYVSGPNDKGNVIIFQNYEGSDAYVAEKWGKIKTFEDFVEKSLDSVLENKAEYEMKEKEGCGTGCD